MARHVIVLTTALLGALCAVPAAANPSSLGILSQNYWVSTYEFYEAVIAEETSSATFGPTVDPVVKLAQSATPSLEIRYHALWPSRGSDVLLHGEADYLRGRVAAGGVVVCPPEWTHVRLTAQVEAGGQVTFRPVDDLQVIWGWEYVQKEGPLPLSATWSFTDLTTGEEWAMSTAALSPPAGQMMLNLVAAHQYSSDWYLVAGSTSVDDLVAFPGDPRTVDAFGDLQMSLVVIPAPGAVVLAILGAGLVRSVRRRAKP
jgi:hypothetical protein